MLVLDVEETMLLLLLEELLLTALELVLANLLLLEEVLELLLEMLLETFTAAPQVYILTSSMNQP